MSLKTRLIRWFFLNLLFALTPLFAVIVIRLLASKFTLHAMEENLAEILFFALMISVTALGDLMSEVIETPTTQKDLLLGLKFFLILAAT